MKKTNHLIISFLFVPFLLCGCQNESKLNNSNAFSIEDSNIFHANFYVDEKLYDSIEYTKDNYLEKNAPSVPNPDKHYFNYWYPNVDFSNFYDCDYDMMTTLEFRTKNGGFKLENDSFVSVMDNSLGVSNSLHFSYGTYKAKLHKSIEKEDSGLIFGLTFHSVEPDIFWEKEGISYYYFYINQVGAAVLSKINNGKYKTLINVPISLSKTDYSLAISLKDNKIKCFVDDALLINYEDNDKLTGDLVGFRLHHSESSISNYIVENSFAPAIDGYEIASGDGSRSGNVVSILEDKTLFYNKNETIRNTDYICSILQNNNQQTGMIFGLDKNISGQFYEDDVSYFSFYINESGTLILESIIDGVKNVIYSSYSISSFKPTEQYLLKISFLRTKVFCYLNNTNIYTYTNTESFVGTLYGYKSSLAGSIITLM